MDYDADKHTGHKPALSYIDIAFVNTFAMSFGHCQWEDTVWK